MKADKWHRCYDLSWQGEITPESFCHPAKFSRALIRRIYEHAFEQGWLHPGDVILDPFGGVALGGLDAMWNGLNYVGVELEPKFVALGLMNIMLWERKYGSKEGFGSARIIQGDSRGLVELVGKADLVCSSPPFQDSMIESGDPNYAYKFHGSQKDYGSSPGQLGAMKEGDFDCVVGSPPFSHPNEQPVASQSGLLKKGYEQFKSPAKMARGSTGGNLESLPEGRFEAVISSPPYEEAISNPSKKIENTGAGGPIHPRNYSADRQNLGNSAGPTFWSAAREIVVQCHTILKPGGRAIFVTKDFVRKSRRVPFSDQW